MVQKDRKDLVLIDFEKNGNQLRLFFGNENGEQYGDDWNDAPYQHNAGRVYEKFIKDTAVISFYYDDIVYEPADEYWFEVSKEDMVNGKVAAFVVLPVKYREAGVHYRYYSFQSIIGMKNSIKFYFGMTVSEIENILNKNFPKNKTYLDFSENFNYF